MGVCSFILLTGDVVIRPDAMYCDPIALTSIIFNEGILPRRFLKLESSYFRGFTVLGAIALTSIIFNEGILACRLCKVQGSYVWVS